MSKTLGGRAGCKIQRTCFGSSYAFRIDPEESRTPSRRGTSPPGGRPAQAVSRVRAAFAEDIPTMVSKRLQKTNCGEQSFRKRTAWPPVACTCFQHNAGPTGLGPREAAARVWSIASGGNDSLRRRRATVSSLPAADTHLHANAPRRAPRKNSAFSPADTRRRASPPATHRIDSRSPRADTRSHRSLPRRRARPYIRRRPASASPTP